MAKELEKRTRSIISNNCYTVLTLMNTDATNLGSFYLASGEFYPLSIGPGKDVDEFMTPGPSGNYYRGVQWDYQGQTIRIAQEGHSTDIMPCPNTGKIVVCYHPSHSTFGGSRNLVVYNPDGSIHCRPATPILISPKENYPHISGVEAEYFKFLEQWEIFKGEVVLPVQLEMGRNDFVEIRVFDAETGECGDLIATICMR